MTAEDVKREQSRIENFNRLNEVAQRTRWVLDEITKSDPTGPCQQGPFTGNTRESRQIKSLHIEFTQTRGGSAPVKMTLDDLYISAPDLGRYLQNALKDNLARVTAEMEKI